MCDGHGYFTNAATGGRLRAKKAHMGFLKSKKGQSSFLSSFCSNRTAHGKFSTPTRPLSTPKPNLPPGVGFVCVGAPRIHHFIGVSGEIVGGNFLGPVQNVSFVSFVSLPKPPVLGRFSREFQVQIKKFSTEPRHCWWVVRFSAHCPHVVRRSIKLPPPVAPRSEEGGKWREMARFGCHLGTNGRPPV